MNKISSLFKWLYQVIRKVDKYNTTLEFLWAVSRLHALSSGGGLLLGLAIFLTF